MIAIKIYTSLCCSCVHLSPTFFNSAFAKVVSFQPFFNFDDSNSDTDGWLLIFYHQPVFFSTAGRYSNGQLVIGLIGKFIFISILSSEFIRLFHVLNQCHNLVVFCE